MGNNLHPLRPLKGDGQGWPSGVAQVPSRCNGYGCSLANNDVNASINVIGSSRDHALLQALRKP